MHSAKNFTLRPNLPVTDTWDPLKETLTGDFNQKKLCHWLKPLREPIKTSRSKRKQKKNLSLTSLRATVKKWSCNCKRRLKMRIEGKPRNFEQRKTVHCPLSYLNYILQMNAFLSLNPLPLKLAQSCSALLRVVRSLSTSVEGNCREIVSFPHPPSLPVNHITKELCQEQRCKNALIMEF